jgi:transcriptional regulator with XRE-family HTH domain
VTADPDDSQLREVGRRISLLRTAAGWKLGELADATGYTRSYISQVERGASIPSLTALATIASALDVEMMDLLQDVAPAVVTVTRASEGHQIRLDNGAVFRVRSRIGGERPYTVIVQNLAFEPVEQRLIGERFMTVLTGAADVTVGGDRHRLDEGDTLHYGAHEAHVVAKATDHVEVLIVSRPAIL